MRAAHLHHERRDRVLRGQQVVIALTMLVGYASATTALALGFTPLAIALVASTAAVVAAKRWWDVAR